MMLKRPSTLANWVIITCVAIGTLGVRLFTAQAQTPTGTIAYVRSGGETGDQIRLIEPDGSNDRELWTVPVEDPNNIFEILSLDWRPDATELAFSSDHEHACSIYASDLYAIRPDGSNLRRVSNGPHCAALADYPQGGVTVTIRNFTSRFETDFFIYVQGAPDVIGVSIPHNGVATVTFPEVADFGDVDQVVAVLQHAYRWYVASVDVQPGETVTATPDPAPAVGDGALEYGAWGPTWRSDGSRIGYARSAGSCLSGYSVPANNTPVAALGNPVLTSDEIAPCSMAWAPTAAKANQVIFIAFPNLGMDGATFYLATEGDSASEGEKLFSIGSTNMLLWFDWAPDGESFLFVRTTKFANISFVESNLFEYNFATGEITQISNLTAEFVRSFGISPNGQQIIFERAPTIDSATSDLWIMNRDGSDLHLLIEDGMRPSWSLQEPQVPDNSAPLADAGDDQSVNAGATVSLDGTGSSDPDGNLPLIYHWQQVGGTTVALATPDSASAGLVAPATSGILTFTLTVTDSLGLASAPDTVSVTVNNQPNALVPSSFLPNLRK